MTSNHLLAKSHYPDRLPKTLVQHTLDVVNAAERMFGTEGQPTRLGTQWLRFFRIAETPEQLAAEWPKFHAALLASCLLHDWGKANEEMQQVFAGRRCSPLFRHEHLSVLMMGCEGTDRWLRQRTDIDWDVVLAAVGSHHLKFTFDDFAREVPERAVRVHADHDDFRKELVGHTADRLRLAGSPELPKQTHWGFVDDRATFNVAALRERLEDRLNGVKTTPLLRAVRSALIVADAAGSGVPRVEQGIDQWIDERFDEARLCDEAVIRGIVDKRIADLTQRKRWSKWNEFQDRCESLPDRALLLAPCGAGKTLAAWRWILGRVRERSVSRILFLYPTRATATEGFKDYVSWAPEGDASLLHGTAGYDLDGMFPSTDPRHESKYGATDPRLFALQHWSKRVFSATVDQFLAFLSYSYGPMCLLPLLADSVIVVDEVHSFDKKMFSALLGFLKEFDVPVLCMTATMQDGRKKQLADLVAKVYGYDEQPEELAAIANKPRYQVSRIAEAEAEKKVRDAVAEGKRVLWVVNQVSHAQTVAAAALADLSPICYHSRFTLNDRVCRHRETVDAIRPGQPAAVAVATQVCEMSLDIDADVLVTEECPITSLIQRMGRCRRGRDELGKGPGQVYVYPPAEEKVYSKDDLAGLGAFLAFLESKSAASQADLESGLETHGPKGTDAPKLNSFLRSGAFADGKEDTFRDIEAFNVPAVLDVEVYLAAKKDRQPGLIVPVPRKLKPKPHPKLPPYLHEADPRHYDPKTGYHDDPLR